MRQTAAPLGWLALVCAAVAAQLGALPCRAEASAFTRPLLFERLDERDGLSDRSVTSILQDSHGYLWLGTAAGLDRYDGYSIREYRRERGNPHGLASDAITSLAEDARGNLWIGTDGGGVAHYDRRADSFQPFRHDPSSVKSLASDAVAALLIDSRGQLWVGTRDRGLDLLDARNGRARHFRHRTGDEHSLASDAVHVLYTDSKGQLWVGSDNGLSRYDPEHEQFINLGAVGSASALSDPHVLSVREDHTGALWIGTRHGGLWRLEPATGRLQSFHHDANDTGSLSADQVAAILEDDAKRLWVATDAGLDLLEPAGRFEHYAYEDSNSHGLPRGAVQALYQDRGGVLWVGTREGGAGHWDPRTWLLGLYRSATFQGAAISSFADDGDGTLWVGIAAGGLIQLNAATGQELRLGEEQVTALQYDPAGALWIGTRNAGLERLDLSTHQLSSYRHAGAAAHALPSDEIVCLLRGRLGALWIGTAEGLARVASDSGQLMRVSLEPDAREGLRTVRVTALAQDLSGNLWVGTDQRGLLVLDSSGQPVSYYRHEPQDPSSLGSDGITSLHTDGRGVVWVGTAGAGLERVLGSSDSPQSVNFRRESRRLESLSIVGIESDHQGHLWISTDHGLVRYDPLVSSVIVYHQSHGLQGDRFNFNAHHRSANGTLYFGGNDGFNAFQPHTASVLSPPPPLVLTSVATAEHTLTPDELPRASEPLELSYEANRVSFDFAALDFSSPADNRYVYRLEGVDSGWIDAGTLHHASYEHLQPGDYVFTVRAANAYGTWSPEALSIPLRVQAAPWNTTAARTGYAVALLMLLSYFWQRQQERRSRLQRMQRLLDASRIQRRLVALGAGTGRFRLRSRVTSSL
jgi:ligand-binding sensor domain-containing protein